MTTVLRATAEEEEEEQETTNELLLIAARINLFESRTNGRANCCSLLPELTYLNLARMAELQRRMMMRGRR
jgi:hypothetical protein